MRALYSTILFDFDGTLTSSLELWLQAFHYAFTKLGVNITDDLIVRRCFYRDLDQVVKEFNLPGVSQFIGLLKEGLAIHFEAAQLFAGVEEILSSCADENIRLAIVTSSPRSIVERTLKSLNIFQYFEVLVTADDVTYFKPHPEPVLLALKRLESKAENAVVIGDSHADILAGQAASIKTGLFYPDSHVRFYDLEELKKTNPNFVFHSFAELHPHIFKMSF